MIICYVAGINYLVNKVVFDGNNDFKPFEIEFETAQETIEYAAKVSDLYSISVQFYI